MRAVGVAILILAHTTHSGSAQEVAGLNGELTLGVGAIALQGAPSSGSARPIGRVQFGLSSKTRTQELKFALNAEAVSSIGSDIDAGLSYTRNSKSSRLSLDLRHSRRSAGFPILSTVSENTDRLRYVDLETVASARRSSGGAIAFQTGIGRPVGAELSLWQRRRDVTPQTGFKQTGRRSHIGAAFRFDVSRRSAFRAKLRYQRFRGDGVVRQEQVSRRLGVGFVHSVNRRTKVELDFGYRSLALTEAGIEADQDGVEWRVGISQARRKVSLSAVAERRQTGNGRLISLDVGAHYKMMDMAIDLALGAARLGHAKTEPTVDLTFTRTWPRAAIEVGALRGYSGSDLSTGVRLVSQVSLRAEQQIGRLGRLELRLDAYKDSASATMTDQSTRQARVTYTHSLTKDWGLSGGAQFLVSRQGAAPRESSSGVFVRLERNFSGAL